MALTVHDSGTLTITAVGTAQEFWTAFSTNGSYQLHVQLDTLVDGDKIELWYETQVIAAAGYSQAFPKAYYAHDQGARVAILPEIKNTEGLKGWINQTNGTARSFKWILYKYA